MSAVDSGWCHKKGHLFYHELQGFLDHALIANVS